MCFNDLKKLFVNLIINSFIKESDFTSRTFCFLMYIQ